MAEGDVPAEQLALAFAVGPCPLSAEARGGLGAVFRLPARARPSHLLKGGLAVSILPPEKGEEGERLMPPGPRLDGRAAAPVRLTCQAHGRLALVARAGAGRRGAPVASATVSTVSPAPPWEQRQRVRTVPQRLQGRNPLQASHSPARCAQTKLETGPSPARAELPTLDKDTIHAVMPGGARATISARIDHYNNRRLHSAIGYVTPRDKLRGLEI